MPPDLPIEVPKERLADFCRRWQVAELALFGSVLKDDFGPDSDVDVLVELASDHGLDLFDWVDMVDELKTIFARDVHLLSKRGLKNPFRRRAILGSRRVIHASTP